MIFIKDSDLPVTNKIINTEKYIGVSGDSNFEHRTFVLPAVYKNIDISSNDFVFFLEVEPPAGSARKPYISTLDKEIIDDKIYLTWKITRYDVLEDGEIKCSIRIANKDDIVKQTYKYTFIAAAGINAAEEAEVLEKPVLEQYIIEAAAHANNSKVESERAKNYAGEANEIIEEIKGFVKNIESMPGLQGEKGDPGESAYQAAVKGGYSGDIARFYADLAALDGLADAMRR